MPYDPGAVEPRWQRYWLDQQTFRAAEDPSRPKYYVLDMFPYPSGEGLHVGHLKGYISTDAVARYKRMRGFNVMHPMGWDAFGLPAEQYAVKTGTHPRITTRKNIDTYRRQLRTLGLSYDWSREIDTTDPGYVKWTQWIFQQLYRRGLAYQALAPVNWCPALRTVLANEEVVDGKSERGGHPVVRVPMKQWMLRITDYAERLLADLDEVDWPEHIKRMQVEWIGRSEGARVVFALEGREETIEVFTTRPDTLFGATYMVLAPEHPLTEKIATPQQAPELRRYIEAAQRKSERARLAESTEKEGVFTGAFAVNPVNQERIPVWTADYVLAGYGTGAIMAVPAHDQRDWEFAKRYALPIREVVETGGDVQEAARPQPGRAVNSDFLDGLTSEAAKQAMNDWLEARGCGARSVTYKLRDWLFSRQRYWGEPFPVLHLENGEHKLTPEAELPVLLPELNDWKPSGEAFETPLSRVPQWIHTSDSESGAAAQRDPNTMPNWAGSCWYYLRFLDPDNDAAPFDPAAERYWMPVDLYVGGAEHAVLHLLYARFWHKVLYDLGVVHSKEPFQRLLNPGMILGHAWRYYDDNLADDPQATPTLYSFEQVQVQGERVLSAESGAELKARFVPADALRRDAEGRPLHPERDDIVLEEVIEKMSKSRGNVVSPDQVIERFGADALRLYELFMGPLEKGAPWSIEGIPGCHRFLQRVYRLFVDDANEAGYVYEAGNAGNANEAGFVAPGDVRPLVEGAGTAAQQRLTAQTIAGVSADMDAIQPNTALAKLMTWVRDIGREGPLPREAAEAFLKMLSPFAPHLAEELWEQIGNAPPVSLAAWPEYDAALLLGEEITLVVQVNGKRRAEIVVAKDADEETIRARAFADESVVRNLGDKEVRRVVVVPGRLVNIVT